MRDRVEVLRVRVSMEHLASEVAELQETVARGGGSLEDVRSWYWASHARMHASSGAATRALTLEEARSWGRLAADCAAIREECRLQGVGVADRFGLGDDHPRGLRRVTPLQLHDLLLLAALRRHAWSAMAVDAERRRGDLFHRDLVNGPRCLGEQPGPRILIATRGSQGGMIRRGDS